MGTITSKNNILYWTIQKGVTESITISKDDGWAYDEILMEFKQTKDIDDYELLTLEVGSGLTVVGNNLTIDLTYAQTQAITVNKLFADIKLRTGTTILEPIPFIIITNQTVTKIV